MNGDDVISLTYAEALLNVASRRNLVPPMIDDANQILQVVAQHPKFQFFLNSPAIEKKEKKEFVEKLLGQKILPPMVNLLFLLIDKGRTAYLSAILRQFLELEQKSRGIFPAKFVSAMALDKSTQEKIKERLEKIVKAQLRIDFQVNPQIIGGALFKFEDILIDSTLLNGLNQLRRRLKEVKV